MPSRKEYGSFTPTNAMRLDDVLLTAAQVGEALGLSEDAVYVGCGLAGELTPIRRGRRYTRFSQKQLNAVIAKAVQEAVEQRSQDSPEQQSNVIPLTREKRSKPFSREELDYVIQLVKEK